QLAPAQVVRDPLERGRRERHVERRLQERDVLFEDLLLEVLGPRRYHHFQPREDRRHQVRQRLARARARLDQQRPPPPERLLHGTRQAQLRRPRLPPRQPRRQPPARTEHIQDRLTRFLHVQDCAARPHLLLVALAGGLLL